MWNNRHLSSNGCGNKGQVPLDEKGKEKLPPSRQISSNYNHFLIQFDLGNQTDVFHRIQDAMLLLVRIFFIYCLYSQSFKNLSLLCRNKNQYLVWRKQHFKNNEQLGYTVHSSCCHLRGCESPSWNCGFKMSIWDLGCLSACPAQRKLKWSTNWLTAVFYEILVLFSFLNVSELWPRSMAHKMQQQIGV